MAQNRINLSPEDQQMFEEYFKQKNEPSMVDNAFDITPDKLNPLAQSIANGGQDLMNMFQSPNFKTSDESFNFNQNPSQNIEVPQENEQPPFYQLPFEKQGSPVSQFQQVSLKMPMPQQQITPQASSEMGSQQPSAMQNLLGEYKKLYSPGQLQTDVDQMTQALDKKKELALLDMFMKGGSQLAAGIARTKPAETIQTAGLADIDIEKAKQKSGLTDRQRQALEAQMKILDVEEMSDPSSPTSKIYRQTLKEMAPSIASMPELKNASAHMVAGVYPMVKDKLSREAQGAQRELLLGLKQQQIEQRQKEEGRRTQQAYYNVSKDFEGNSTVKELKKQGLAFDQVDKLIGEAERGNEAALGSVGTKLAKAMGEVGPLTESDVTRYLGNSSYARQFQTWRSKRFEGKMPKPAGKDIRIVAQMMRDLQQTQLLPIYETYAGRMVELSDGTLSPEDALRKLSAPGYENDFFKKKPKKQEVPSIDDFEDIE
jgi:hypothetical protein